MRRKRIKSNGTLMAWSNGKQTHLRRKQTWELKADFVRQQQQYRRRVAAGYEWASDRPAVMRGESMLREEYSDRLWGVGLHVESMLELMQAAVQLIDWDEIVLGPEINYYHPNLSRFRYLIGRCRKRVDEDPRLEPLLANSMAHDWFVEMEERYAGCKVSGWTV